MATIINKFRQWLMNFLGILGLELAAKRRYEALENKLDDVSRTGNVQYDAIIDSINQQLKAINEFKIKELGDISRVVDMFGELSERIGRIENMFVSQHVPSRQNQVVEYDWEQVQSMVLNEMMKNPPKEEN